jgi:hypothetical protein
MKDIRKLILDEAMQKINYNLSDDTIAFWKEDIIKYPQHLKLKNNETMEECFWFAAWSIMWQYLGQLAAFDAGGLCVIERFDSQEELLEKHPGARWHFYGPIHKHDTGYYVQTYLGQHEWLAINVDDITDIKYDAGWDGTNFGYGFVNCTDEIFEVLMKHSGGEINTAPEREGKPLTTDNILFADESKLKEYLGENDPIYKKE